MTQNQEESRVKLTRIKGTGIAKITIQNPPMNQLSGEVLRLIETFLEKVKRDEKTIALIIDGKGLFSAGADANEIYAIAQEGGVEKVSKLLAGANAVTDAIENLGKPTVAVINSFCLGGGNELAMACTIRVAAEDAKFGQPEIKLGIMPGMGGTQRLPRLTDLETALKLLFSGEIISAQDALVCGLVNAVFTKSELDQKALEFATYIVENSNNFILAPLQYGGKAFDTKKFDDLVLSDLFREWTEKKSKDAVDYIVASVKSGMCLPLHEALKLEQKLFAELVVKDSAKAGLAKFLGKGRASKGSRFLLLSDKLPDVFTIGDLNEDQLLIRDSVRELVADTIAKPEVSARIESKDFQYTRQLMREFANLGILGIEVPEEYGGLNLGTIVSTVVAEEMSVQGSFVCTYLAHTGIGTLPIRFFGNEEQKMKYLPKLISGEWVSAYSLTEGTAGSDANSVKATARLSKDGTYYVLNGEKIFVTNGGFADLFIIFAKIDGKDLSAFIVEKTFDGLKIGREEHKMGIQGSSTAVVLLDNAKVPVENLLGERGKGLKIALNILNLGRFKLGVACLGAGKLCLRESLAYAKERKQFGQPISSFGAIRRKLAEMASKNYEMEAVVYRTAGLLEEAIRGIDANDSRALLKAIEDFAVECSLVKVACSEALDFVVDENVQIHGGSGFCEELPPARHYRDSRINRLFEGTNEIIRLVMSGMVLKKMLTGSLPLSDAVKDVVRDPDKFYLTEPEDVVDRLNLYLNNAKKATLLSFGMAYEKFGFDLEKHQMVLMSLADCMIVVYVLEGVLASLAKNRTDINILLARLVFNDNFYMLYKLTRELIGMCLEGDESRDRLAQIYHLIRIPSVNVEELRNVISESLLGA